MGTRRVSDWKTRPFSDLYRPSRGKETSLLLKITGYDGAFSPPFLDASLPLQVLDMCMSYFSTVCLTMFNRLLRQRVILRMSFSGGFGNGN